MPNLSTLPWVQPFHYGSIREAETLQLPQFTVAEPASITDGSSSFPTIRPKRGGLIQVEGPGTARVVSLRLVGTEDTGLHGGHPQGPREQHPGQSKVGFSSGRMVT